MVTDRLLAERRSPTTSFPSKQLAKISGYQKKQDYLRMNQTIILGLQIFLDHRSSRTIDQKILMTLPPPFKDNVFLSEFLIYIDAATRGGISWYWKSIQTFPTSCLAIKIFVGNFKIFFGNQNFFQSKSQPSFIALLRSNAAFGNYNQNLALSKFCFVFTRATQSQKKRGPQV